MVKLENIGKSFGAKTVLRDFSLDIREGERFVLLGESGCGKTTTARLILQVEQPTGGQINFNGKNMAEFTNAERREYRASVQAVFQDPWSSLNPRMKVGDIILEPLITNKTLSKAEAKEELENLLRDVGLRT
ncbi:MAG: ATP-binding cassette domain-containing protein, partial [Nitrospinae bacterium]|nr:ATP-binding cassette domain-containing protein [Nitrospinota bacterium]